MTCGRRSSWPHSRSAGRCARLVTTRIPSLAKGASVPVKVDQMSETQARALLSAGLPPLPAAVAAGLLEETGRWPLLLRLVNKILADQAQLQPDIAAAAEDLLGRLRRGGALQVDQLTGAAGQQLDVSDPDQRQQAVRATIQASTSLLSAAEHDRFAELAVFAEDETIPVTLITALWQATGGLDRMATRALCARLADLALLTLSARRRRRSRHRARRHPGLPARRTRQRPAGPAAPGAAGRRGGRPAHRRGGRGRRRHGDGVVGAARDGPVPAGASDRASARRRASRSRPRRSPRICGGPGRGCRRPARPGRMPTWP